MPYLIQEMFGRSWAIAFALVCVLTGIRFLISAHTMTETKVPRTSVAVSSPNMYRASVRSNARIAVFVGFSWVVTLLVASPHGKRGLLDLVAKLHALWK
jgi:hypothetical protein